MLFSEDTSQEFTMTCKSSPTTTMILRAPTTITVFRKEAENQILGFSGSNVRGYLGLGEAQNAYKNYLRELQETKMVSYAVTKDRHDEFTQLSDSKYGSMGEANNRPIKSPEPSDGNGFPSSDQTEHTSPKSVLRYRVGQKEGVETQEENIINSRHKLPCLNSQR